MTTVDSRHIVDIERHFRHHLRMQQASRLAYKYFDRSKVLRSITNSLIRTVWSQEIPCEVRAQPGLVFMHNGLGVVIHPDVLLSAPALIFHGVTLGNAWRAEDGAPTIREFSFIGAGATVLGPVTVGPFAAVGAGTVVLNDVPPMHMAIGSPATLRPLSLNRLAEWFHLTIDGVDEQLRQRGLRGELDHG